MNTVKAIDGMMHFSTLSGTPSDVSTKLSKMKSERIIALVFDHGTDRDVNEMVDVLNNLASLMGNLKKEHQKLRTKAFEAVIEALVTPVPLPSHKIAEAKMTAHARNAVFESGDWLTAAHVAEMAGFSKSNPSAQPNKWKKERAIFAINRNGIDYFPGYALDPKTKFRPYKSVADIIEVFGDKKDAWGLAYWFSSVNSFLGGRRPQDMLAIEPARVIAAANDEVEDLAGVAHG